MDVKYSEVARLWMCATMVAVIIDTYGFDT